MFNKYVISGLSILTLAPTALFGISTSTAYASDVGIEEKSEQSQEVNQKEYYENLGYEVYEFESYEDLENHIDVAGFEDSDGVITPYATVSGGVIFVAGVAVGYLVDGVVINMSGQSVGQWVSDGIDGIINWF